MPLITNKLTGLLLPALAAVVMLLAACGDDSGSDDSSGSTSDASPGNESPIETPAGSPGAPEECSVSDEEIGLVSKLDFEQDGEFRAGGQFTEGQAIMARMRLINCTDGDTTLYFNTTKRYEMSIESEEDAEQLWNSSDGKAFEDKEATETIPPRGTVVYTEEWDQKDKNGAQAPAGTYKVSFLSVACGEASAEDCRFGPIGRVEILAPES
jgi:hypothetical protein